MTTFEFVVEGRPAPQGSKKSFGHGRMVEMSKYVKPWRAAVEAAAVLRKDAVGADDGHVFSKGVPVAMNVTFYLKRPKSHYRTGKYATVLREDAPRWVVNTPDLSKLIRSSEDAITTAGLWADDAQVVQHRSGQRWSDTGFEGAVINLSEVKE